MVDGIHRLRRWFIGQKNRAVIQGYVCFRRQGPAAGGLYARKTLSATRLLATMGAHMQAQARILLTEHQQISAAREGFGALAGGAAYALTVGRAFQRVV